MIPGSITEADLDDYWPPTMPKWRPLTRRQERFCQAYVVYGSAAKAARAAGYSERSARQQAWRLLHTGRVRARLARLHADLGRDFKDSLNVYIGKLELVYRQAVEDRRSLAAVRAVMAQAHLAVQRTKLSTPLDDIAASMQAIKMMQEQDDDWERRQLESKYRDQWARDVAAIEAGHQPGDEPPGGYKPVDVYEEARAEYAAAVARSAAAMPPPDADKRHLDERHLDKRPMTSPTAVPETDADG